MDLAHRAISVNLGLRLQLGMEPVCLVDIAWLDHHQLKAMVNVLAATIAWLDRQQQQVMELVHRGTFAHQARSGNKATVLVWQVTIARQALPLQLAMVCVPRVNIAFRAHQPRPIAVQVSFVQVECQHLKEIEQCHAGLDTIVCQVPPVNSVMALAMKVFIVRVQQQRRLEMVLA